MTTDLVAEARALLDAVTPGPWKRERWTQQVVDGGEGSGAVLIATVAMNTYRNQGRHNGTLIASAPTLIRALLDRCEALQQAVTRAEWHQQVAEDDYKRCKAERDALQEALQAITTG